MAFTFFAPSEKGVVVPGGLISKSYQAIRSLTTRQVRIECDRIPYRFRNTRVRDFSSLVEKILFPIEKRINFPFQKCDAG